VVSVPSSRQETRFPLPERTLTRPRSRSSICFAPAGGVVGGGVVGGGVDGGGVLGGGVLGGGVLGGGVDGGALVDGAPVQAVPLSVNAAGTGFDALFHEPLKPKFAVPPVPMAAL